MAMSEHGKAERPERDPALDRVYAAGAIEEPPERLDAAIRAAARREVGARPRRLDALLRAWRAPVALAAVLVLSVTVVLLLREEGADRLTDLPPPAAAPASPADSRRPDDNAPAAPPAEQRDKPASAQPAAPQPESALRRDASPRQPAPAEADRSRKEQGRAESRQEAPRALDEPRPAIRPFAEPPAAPAEPQRNAPSRTDALAKQAESGAAAGAQAEQERPAAPRAPAPPAKAAAPDAASGAFVQSQRARSAAKLPQEESAGRLEDRARADNAAEARPVWQGYENQPPEKWLERVAELRRGARDAEARDMLAEFRRRFPQYPVPAALDR